MLPVTTGALVGIKSFQPLRAYSISLSPFIDGGWLLTALVIVIVLSARKKDHWINEADKAAINAAVIPKATPAASGE